MEGRETEKKEAGSAWNCGYGVVVCVRAAVVVPGDYWFCLADAVVERWRLARLTLSSFFLCCTGAKRHGRQVKEIEMLVSSQKMPLSNDITSSIPFSFYFFPSILLCVCVFIYSSSYCLVSRWWKRSLSLSSLSFVCCRISVWKIVNHAFLTNKVSPLPHNVLVSLFHTRKEGRKPVNELLCLSLLSQLYRSVSGIRGGKSPYDMCAATILYTLPLSGAIIEKMHSVKLESPPPAIGVASLFVSFPSWMDFSLFDTTLKPSTLGIWW